MDFIVVYQMSNFNFPVFWLDKAVSRAGDVYCVAINARFLFYSVYFGIKQFFCLVHCFFVFSLKFGIYYKALHTCPIPMQYVQWTFQMSIGQFCSTIGRMVIWMFNAHFSASSGQFHLSNGHNGYLTRVNCNTACW